MNSFRKLAIASLCATFALVAIGGLVRATKSGLGCGDDWPHCNGRLAPALETRAEIIEFSHRAAAGVVVILIATLAVLALRRHRGSPRIVWTSVGALALVLSQALIGALVVKLDLKAESVVLHLGTAMFLVAVLVYLVAAASPRDESATSDRSLSRQAGGAALAVFLLLLVGSYVTGKGAGLVFPDWPLMNGTPIPDLGTEDAAVHFVHRALAAVVGGIVFITGMRLVRRGGPAAARLGRAAIVLYAAEVLIGAANVWSDLNAAFVTAHLALAALIWGSLSGAAVLLHPAMERVAERRAPAGRAALEGSR